MVDFQYKNSYGVRDLVEIVRILRQPGGCPWDREQDHHSIRRNLLEEAYEAAEAIDEDDPEHLREELGDVLLQVVFAAVNVSRFVQVDPEDALSGACDKFARRFRQVEQSAAERGQALEHMTLAEMDKLWDAAKEHEA